jgi:hypothetical protein
VNLRGCRSGRGILGGFFIAGKAQLLDSIGLVDLSRAKHGKNTANSLIFK